MDGKLLLRLERCVGCTRLFPICRCYYRGYTYYSDGCREPARAAQVRATCARTRRATCAGPAAPAHRRPVSPVHRRHARTEAPQQFAAQVAGGRFVEVGKREVTSHFAATSL